MSSVCLVILLSILVLALCQDKQSFPMKAKPFPKAKPLPKPKPIQNAEKLTAKLQRILMLDPHCAGSRATLQQYAKNHSTFLGSEKKNALVYVPGPRGGMAEQLTEFITASLYAILMNRAIQYESNPNIPSFETAFFPQNIDFMSNAHASSLLEPLKYNATKRQFNKETLQEQKYFAVNAIDEWKLQDKLVNFPLESVFQTEYETIFFALNRGQSVQIFRNKYEVRQLLEFGFEPEITFACVFNFLFRPRPKIFLPVLDTLTEILRNDTVYIGIQINSENTGIDDIDAWMAYFTCAQNIENDYAFEELKGLKTQVRWYLQSDSMALKTRAKEKFGDKILTTLSYAEATDPFSLAAAEILMLSVCTFHVITRMGGLGRAAGFIAMEVNNMWTIERSHFEPKCGNFSSPTNLWDQPYEDSGGI